MKSIKAENNFSKENFKMWIKTAEKSPTMTWEKFNEKWEEKKLKIQNNIRQLFSENYFQNLEEIVDYIAFEKHQPLNPIKIGNGINKTMNKIIENPLIYSECENLPAKSKITEKQHTRLG